MIAVVGGLTAVRAGYLHDHDRGTSAVSGTVKRLVGWTLALAVEFLCWAALPLLGLLVVPFVFLYVVALCTICPRVNDFYRSRKHRENSPLISKHYAV